MLYFPVVLKEPAIIKRLAGPGPAVADQPSSCQTQHHRGQALTDGCAGRIIKRTPRKVCAEIIPAGRMHRRVSVFTIRPKIESGSQSMTARDFGQRRLEGVDIVSAEIADTITKV